MRTILFTLLLTCVAASAQIVTLVSSTNTTQPTITLATNDVARMLHIRVEGDTYGSPSETYVAFSVDFSGFKTYYSRYFPTNEPAIFAGPATIQLNPYGNFRGICTFQIDRAAPTNSTISSTSVVIPADNAGPVQIILESSADLVTWNAAQPGIYGTTNPQRFFRLRAVR